MGRGLNSQAAATVCVLLTLLPVVSAGFFDFDFAFDLSDLSIEPYGTNEIIVLPITDTDVPTTCRPDSEPCPSSLAAAACWPTTTKDTCVTQWRYQQITSVVRRHQNYVYHL